MALFLSPTVYSQADSGQVQLGDPNGDGVFGAELNGATIKPGNPLRSYLFLRVMAPLPMGSGQTMTNVAAPASSEAQMPIANYQYWDIDNAVVALYCWIKGLQADGLNAAASIDYAGCDLSALPKANH